MEQQTGFKSSTSQILNLPLFIFTVATTILLLIFSGFITGKINHLLSFIPQDIKVIDIQGITILSTSIAILWIRLIWRILVIKNLYYDFKDEKITIHYGVINKKINYIEYFRIKDYSVERPLIARLFGLHHFDILSTDRTYPHLKLKYITNFKNREPELREGIKNATKAGRGRELDVV